ncbi:MAG: isocitrate lyase/phosphoenolpyruvate mutase family protein [Pirellulales bacterium]|nr:isocitrate lyase/phosphoenolpyruvate mutase family protein [Pirellulales bacterium]
MSGAKKLLELLKNDKIIMAPGAPDALTARLIEQAGFDAVYMTGFAATATLIGCPDLGLSTQTEMTTHARSMVRAVDIPVIADADTGYGGPANIERTVREYCQAGVAAIHLEDQILPKRCGHMAGVKLVSAENMQRRLKCAIAARGKEDLLIIGRTDACAVFGVDEALNRARCYLEAGVDMLFIDAVKKIDDARLLGEALKGATLIISMVEGNETAQLLPDELKQMGFSIALYPLSTLLRATYASREMLADLKENGTTLAKADQMMTYGDFSKVVDLDRYNRLDDNFGID